MPLEKKEIAVVLQTSQLVNAASPSLTQKDGDCGVCLLIWLNYTLK